MLGYGAKNLAKKIDESTISSTCGVNEVNILKDAFKAITTKDMQSPCYMNPDKINLRNNYKDISKCEQVNGSKNCETCFENDAYPKCKVDFSLFYHPKLSNCNQCKPLCPNFPIRNVQYNWDYVYQSGVGEAIADAGRKVH